MRHKYLETTIVFATMLLLSACGNSFNQTSSTDSQTSQEVATETQEEFTQETELFLSQNQILTNDLDSVENQILTKGQEFYSDTNGLKVSVLDVTFEKTYSAMSSDDTTGSSQEEAESTSSGIYIATVRITDQVGNSAQGQIQIYYDAEAPYLMNTQGKVTSFEDQTFESADLTVEPTYDLTGYEWKDNEAVASATDTIVCVDETNHVWLVDLNARDTAGNVSAFSYKITVVSPSEDTNTSSQENKSDSGTNSETKTSKETRGNSETLKTNGQAATETSTETSTEPDTNTSSSTSTTNQLVCIPSGAGIAINHSSNKTMDKQVLDDMNDLRASLGLTELTYDEGLYQIALARANDMINNGYFDHYYNGEAQFTAVAEKMNYRKSLMGENIAKTNQSNADGHYIYTMWYNSPSHYENMVYEDYRTVGIAIVPYTATSDYYYVNSDGSKTYAYSDDCTYYMGVEIFAN